MGGSFASGAGCISSGKPKYETHKPGNESIESSKYKGGCGGFKSGCDADSLKFETDKIEKYITDERFRRNAAKELERKKQAGEN